MALRRVADKDKFEWQSKVLSRVLATPPLSPTKGDRYIVPSGSSGAWTGQTNRIAEYNGLSWDFYIPSTFFTLWVENEVVQYYWNGTIWKLVNDSLAQVEEAKRYALLVGGGE